MSPGVNNCLDDMCIGAQTLSPVPTCPKNRKNRGFLRFSDLWDSYGQQEHRIPDIPDGRQFLRRDRKSRKHFYFEGPSQTVPDNGDFYDECEHETVNMKLGCLGHRGCLILSFLATKA